MLEKVKDYIQKNQMITKGDTIILGISGGADSVCLFFVLLELKELYDLNLVAVHVNHNLRGEDAVADQNYVEALCASHGIPCVVVSVDVEAEARKRKKSLEETGREVRQEAFAAEAKVQEMECPNQRVKIATAHHGNDNAETFLMNLARGTGIGGLTGISSVRENYIRPLLGVRREEIEKYLEENKIPYCIDKTNHENIYIRNVIRNQVVPILEEGINSQAVAHIESTMEELGKIEAYLQEQVTRCREDYVSRREGGLLLDKEMLEKEPEIIREKLLKKALEEVAGRQRDITRVHVEQLGALFQKQVGREIHLPYEMVARRVYQGVELKQGNVEVEAAQGEVKIQILDREEVLKNHKNDTEHFQDTPYTKYFDYDIMEKIPSVRVREIGDQLIINTSGNKQSLKKYYVTNKIPSDLRSQIPVLAIGNDVLWVIGYRKSCGYEVTETTRKILEVQYNGGYYGRNN